ncbi:MAG TPA: efflux RND transporter periplasmic adaptor subunit [Gemmatimonadales bacterium]|nr:efflux RND transporter periplasmic adaptor subunit [Gemmatimonadales bacterium]
MSTAPTLDPGTATTSPSSGRRWLPAAVAVVAILAIAAWWAWSRTDTRPAAEQAAAAAPAPGPIRLSAEAERAAGLATAPAREVLRADRFEAPAVIALDETHTARVGSMVEGRVVSVEREVGDRVTAGMLLGALHSPVVHEAWAAYRTALAERRRQTSELAFAREAEARASRLFADKAISAQELQRAEANRRAIDEALDMTATELRRAEEELEHLGVTNADDPTGESGETIPVRAPLGGVVLERLVTPGTAVTPGLPLFVVSDLSSLWVLVEIDESRLSRVSVGRPVHVRVSAYPDEEFTGTVSFVGDVVNPRTRRVTVRCVVGNPDGRLKPEMFATAVLDTGAERRVVTVPASAVHDLQGKTVVFVREASGGFRERVVSVGPERDGEMEVLEGLRAGEPVATAGAFLLKSERLAALEPEQ